MFTGALSVLVPETSLIAQKQSNDWLEGRREIAGVARQ